MMRWKPSVPNGVSGSGMSDGWVASLYVVLLGYGHQPVVDAAKAGPPRVELRLRGRLVVGEPRPVGGAASRAGAGVLQLLRRQVRRPPAGPPHAPAAAEVPAAVLGTVEGDEVVEVAPLEPLGRQREAGVAEHLQRLDRVLELPFGAGLASQEALCDVRQRHAIDAEAPRADPLLDLDQGVEIGVSPLADSGQVARLAEVDGVHA